MLAASGIPGWLGRTGLWLLDGTTPPGTPPGSRTNKGRLAIFARRKRVEGHGARPMPVLLWVMKTITAVRHAPSAIDLKGKYGCFGEAFTRLRRKREPCRLDDSQSLSPAQSADIATPKE
jgi:hypothetical protein